MLKRTPLKKIGKRGKINLGANRKIAKMWQERGITKCEIGLPGCLGDYLLQNCHKHNRSDYYQCPEMLHNYYQVIRGCQNCHFAIDHDKKLKAETFARLR